MQLLLAAAQSWQAAPPFPHAVWDVPAMHRSFKQHPFAHDMTLQRAPPLELELALLEEEALALELLEEEPAPPTPALAPPAPALAPPAPALLLPDVAPPPAPPVVLAPLVPDVAP